jgi:hypothetical protein
MSGIAPIQNVFKFKIAPHKQKSMLKKLFGRKMGLHRQYMLRKFKNFKLHHISKNLCKKGFFGRKMSPSWPTRPCA